ncbi:MAG: elongation factor P 5-aminopentanone reductase [Acutalibacteraceae bacterium]
MMRKTAIVTGASRGIGREIAFSLARDGFNIAVNYNHSEKEALCLAKTLKEKFNVFSLAVKGDVSSPQSAENMVEAVKVNFGNIDVLINNAGISNQKLFTHISNAEWQNMMDTNLNSLFYVTKNVVPIMVKNKSGVIVNIGSMWGSAGASMEVHYSTAKAGVIGFTKALAKELAPSNIRVNMVSPGVVNTDMISVFDENAKENLRQNIPLKRIGNPKDIADAVSFLCSDDASYITGENINVNGGFII